MVLFAVYCGQYCKKTQQNQDKFHQNLNSPTMHEFFYHNDPVVEFSIKCTVSPFITLSITLTYV